MANPFLVLGGIAVGIVTAGFGILQVPGWVASAQDAAATNDVAQVSLAQGAAMSLHGAYRPTIEALTAGGDTTVSVSSGVTAQTATNPDNTAYLTVARSSSGTYFARISGSAKTGSSNDLEAAVVAAGTSVTNWVTAQGVPLPNPTQLGRVVRTNLVLNPDVTTTDYIGANPLGGTVRTVTDLSLRDLGLPTTYRQIQWTAAPTTSPASIGVRSIPVTGGETYTLSAYTVSSFRLATGLRVDLEFYDKDGARIGSSLGTSQPYVMPAVNTWTRVDRTITVPEGTAALTMNVAFSGPQTNGAGGWIGATGFLAEEGTQLGTFFSASSGQIDGKAYWTGAPGKSPSVLVQ